MTDKDEIAALRARIDKLESANKPPAPPDMSDWQPFDPTARMSMSPQVARDMAAAIPDRVVRDIALRDNRAPTGPTGMSPSSSQITSVHPGGGPTVPGGGSGWREAAPLTPPPGIRMVDALCIADDVKQRSKSRP